MKDAVGYASSYLLGKNAMIIKDDCYIGPGFEQLDETILGNKTMYFLTRHAKPEMVRTCQDVTDNCGQNAKYIGSHSALLFRLVVPVSSQLLYMIDVRQNDDGYKQVSMFYLRRIGGFTVKNPCKILHISLPSLHGKG